MCIKKSKHVRFTAIILAVILLAVGMLPGTAQAAKKPPAQPQHKMSIATVKSEAPGEITVDLKVKQVKGGYVPDMQIAIARDASFKKGYDTILTTDVREDDTSVTINDSNYLYGKQLNQGGKFYIKVRARYNNDDNDYKYKKWSSVKSCVVKKKKDANDFEDGYKGSEKVKILKCENYAEKQMCLTFKFPKNSGDEYLNSYYCEIYRGTSPNRLTLYETADTNFPHSHGTPVDAFSNDDPAEWYAAGDNGKITFYVSSSDHDSVELFGKVTGYDSGLSFGKTYYYQVVLKKTINEDSSNVPGIIMSKSNIIAAKSKFLAPWIKTAYSTSNKAAKITWSQSKYAQGYQIYRKVSSGKWKKVKTISKKKTTVFKQGNLKSGKKYWYKVRAFRKENGKKIYSAYSDSVVIQTKNPTVKGDYKKGSVYGPSLNKKELSEVRRVVQGFKDNYLPKNQKSYMKALIAFNYISTNCVYAERGWQYNRANTAWGSLIYGEAQCSGYARGYKALCDAMGVPCKYVHATNTDHQWNMVKINKKWYIVDAQAGYFLVGSRTYKAVSGGMTWNKKKLPKCSTKDFKLPK